MSFIGFVILKKPITQTNYLCETELNKNISTNISNVTNDLPKEEQLVQVINSVNSISKSIDQLNKYIQNYYK